MLTVSRVAAGLPPAAAVHPAPMAPPRRQAPVLSGWLLALSTAVLVACGGGGGGTGTADSAGSGGGSSSTGSSGSAAFGGPVLAAANGPAGATVAWQAATGTDAASVVYTVHLSTVEGFTPTADNRVASVTGSTQTTLSGLQPGTRYQLRVLARSAQGQAISGGDQALSLVTPDSAPQLSSTTPLQQASALGLGTAVRDGSQLSFTWRSGASLPSVGAVLTGQDSSGAAYLLAVKSATLSGSTLQVQTEQAQLSDVVTAGALHSGTVLFAAPTAGGASTGGGSSSAGASGPAGSSGGATTTTAATADSGWTASLGSALRRVMAAATGSADGAQAGTEADGAPPGTAAFSSAADGSVQGRWPGDLLRFAEAPPADGPAGHRVQRDAATGHYQLSVSQPARSALASAGVGTASAASAGAASGTASRGTAQGSALRVRGQSLVGSASDLMQADLAVDFAPALVTSARWHTGVSGLVLDSAELGASGTLTVDAQALYRFAAQGTYSSATTTLFRRSYVSQYLVGSVPVYQEVTFTLLGQVEASASSAIQAEARARLQQAVQFGVRWDGSSWVPYSSLPGASSAVQASFSVKGGASSTITLQPKVEVKFYALVAGSLSLQPTLSGAISAEAVRNADLLAASFPAGTTQLTVMDVTAQARCYVGASLSFLNRSFRVMDETAVCAVPSFTLFSLPTLALSPQHNPGWTQLQADITDGRNDPFDDGTARWTVSPESAGTLSAQGARQAYFYFASGARTATVFFSGSGVLGEVGRQFAQVTMQAPPAITAGPTAVVDPLAYDGRLNLGVTVDGPGTGHWLVAPADGRATPTVADLLASGQRISLVADQPATLDVSGLSPDRGYAVWFIAASPTGNLQREVQSMGVYMPLRPIRAAGLSGVPPSSFASALNHDEAVAQCAAGRWRGLDGWRLPSRDELHALAASGSLAGAGWAASYHRLWSGDAGTLTRLDGVVVPAWYAVSLGTDGSPVADVAITSEAVFSTCVHP